MIIKTYNADSMATALKLARTELGEDAVVLRSRTLRSVNGIHSIELTACAEKREMPVADTTRATQATTSRIPRPFVPQTITTKSIEKPDSVSVSRTEKVQVSLEQLSAQIEEISRRLNRLTSAETTQSISSSDLPEILRNCRFNSAVRSAIVAKASQIATPLTDESVKTAITQMCAEMLGSELSFKSGDRIVMVGAPGSGKTAALGMIATQAVTTNRMPVTFMTIDQQKVSARDELFAYADLLDSPVIEATNDVPPVNGLLLVNTPALSLDSIRRVETMHRVEALKPTHVIHVVPATMKDSLVSELSAVLRVNCPTYHLLSMTDLSEDWSNALTAWVCGRQPLIGVTRTPAGVGGVVRVTQNQLIEKILNLEAING